MQKKFVGLQDKNKLIGIKYLLNKSKIEKLRQFKMFPSVKFRLKISSKTNSEN